jgi:hypothetical protein
MKKSHLFVALFSGMLALGMLPTAQAALLSITFYEQTGDIAENGHNLFDDYTLAGGGTFEIADIAVFADSLVLFSDPNFLSFEATLSPLSTGDSSTFTLGMDDFQPDDRREQGLLFDGLGAPLRFDRPDTTSSNTRTVCDPTCEVALGGRATLSLLDDDDYETVYLDDGSIAGRSDLLPGTSFTPFAGNWTYGKGTGVDGSGVGIGGLYTLSAVPVPAAAWLFGSGLLGLIGIARRKKS